MPATLTAENLIPEISVEDAQALLKKLRPIVTKDGMPFDIELPDLYNVAFTWDPKLTAPVDMTNVAVVATLYTYHKTGYILFFKPSIAEVLAQLPADLDERAFAFQTFGGEAEIVKNVPGFYGHRTRTVVYGRMR